jgi:phage terminase large subunit
VSEIKLSELFAPSFIPFHSAIKRGDAVHYWLKGGRGSCKSSFVSLQIILGIVRNPEAHAVCFRKFGCDLRGSVFNQVLWAIDILGLRDFFTYSLTPMEITYKPTGQKILFKGLDDSRKSKSQKAQFGYFRYVWFEELEQYDGMQEIRSVCQSLMRGGDKFSYFYSYNFEAGKVVENRLVHHSDYLTVPKDWLGEAFFIEADILRKQNEMAYRHEYLGEVTGTGGTIFTNLISRRITDEEIKQFSNLRKGIDFGYAVDPFAYCALEYDKTRRSIYIYDEIYKVGLLNDAAIELLKAKGIGRERIIADSAEPKSIAEFRQSGLNVIGAEKGKDSVQYGIKWLQKLHSIVIDPIRCPNTWKEFSLYEFEKTKTGDFKCEYPDKLNHEIDSIRYSLSLDMEKKGMF